MNISQNKPFYKVISLFIKSAILFFSFYYIWKRLDEASASLDFFQLFSLENSFFILLILLLMFVNWSFEALKWKLLIAPLETISFKTSLKGIFSGITMSIFTPNRVGEFAGRVFFLEKADKIQASVMSLIGSALQFFVTIIAGVLGYCLLEKKYYDFFQTEQFISTDMLLILIGFFVLIVIVAIYFVYKKQTTFFKKYIDLIKMHSKKELNSVFYLSFYRYAVFSIQYYLALRVFGINGGTMILFSLIALTFFVTSVIPTFALTEIAVRTGVAIYFFGTISSSHVSILAASLFLWIINLAVPALIGSAFVWKLKFFKE